MDVAQVVRDGGGEREDVLRAGVLRDGSGERDDVLRAGVLEIHPREGLAVADGRALTLSVRELGLLVELARSEGHVARREDLYTRVWGAALRPGDRSVDVYIRKLRVKLERALPEWRFIHTHVGFGYRFGPERSHGFHTGATDR